MNIQLIGVILIVAVGPATTRHTPAPPSSATALVSRLYMEVVARHPLGVPYGEDAKVFDPFVSKTLLHRFELNTACDIDWHRRNPDPDLKPPTGMIEDDVFSGPDDRSEPTAFHIERTETWKGGSSRVYVRLTSTDPGTEPMTWYVAAVVVPESGRLVVDDVLYLKDKKGSVDYRLSRRLSSWCRGGHWIGRP
ncbi:MAG TPA: hypothetical protein VG407_11065 [Caulobacteraceae bacterium]|jgi:hypothetical protein|nr:hypothetical protein [Caulobacteraceae bacterium]